MDVFVVGSSSQRRWYGRALTAWRDVSPLGPGESESAGMHIGHIGELDGELAMEAGMLAMARLAHVLGPAR